MNFKEKNNNKDYNYSKIKNYCNLLMYIISVIVFTYNIVNRFNISRTMIVITATLTLMVSLKQLYKSRNNWYLLLVFIVIFYTNYSIIVANYITPFTDTMFTSLAGEIVSNLGLNVLLLFIIMLDIFLPQNFLKMNSPRESIIIKDKENTLLVIIISLILLFILIFGFSRPDVYGERGSPSAMYEYSLIFFIIGFHFSGKNKKNKYLLTLLIIFFIAQNFVFGGRIIGLQLLLAWYLMNYSHRVKLKSMVPIGVIFLIILTAIGSFRAELNISLEGFKTTIGKLIDKKMTLDTAYSAYYTSLTFIKARAIDPLLVRIKLFGRFLLSMIFGGSRVANSSLPLYTRKYYEHFFGGILPYHFYYYLGWIGVIISSYIVSIYLRFINKLTKESPGILKCIAVYVAATTVRWYLYAPGNLFRGVLLLLIIYYLAETLILVVEKIDNLILKYN